MLIGTFRAALSTLFFICIVSAQGYTQPDVSRISVPVSMLREHVYLLASDSLQGRKTGTTGQLQAAFYCTNSFRKSYLAPLFPIDSTRRSFRQTYPFTTTKVSRFGGSVYTFSSPYEQYDLAALPITARDSSQVSFGDNIAGLLIGTDLKREIVILSAHYDHLGRSDGNTYHGADDNASGTATVLSTAAVFDSLAQQGIRPRRSILFVLFSGEEGGLVGSQYFVKNSPIPMHQFVGDLNVDMVGRVDDAHRKKPDYCYLITGSPTNDLKKAAEAVNQQSVNLALNQGGYDVENDPNRYFLRSDHVNFAKLGIPVLFFTNGEHSDYHRPSDTADKIMYDVLQKRATLVFQTAWRVANEAPK